ncbi:unnamed protein product [Toxocara canis]|uniref:Transposase n=1 Tax=Toxocara canis TaxID=6265 RepID=A0A183UMQ4_TOXCA|nr:unnamed protein product [Toxocara canis]
MRLVQKANKREYRAVKSDAVRKAGSHISNARTRSHLAVMGHSQWQRREAPRVDGRSSERDRRLRGGGTTRAALSGHDARARTRTVMQTME